MRHDSEEHVEARREALERVGGLKSGPAALSNAFSTSVPGEERYLHLRYENKEHEVA